VRCVTRKVCEECLFFYYPAAHHLHPDRRTHTPVRRDQPPNFLPGPDKVCTPTPESTPPARSPDRNPQIDNTTTLVYPQVRPTSDEASTMDHLLDLEWTVVEVEAALAGTGSSDPSPAAWPPARRCRTTHARANPTQGPREEDRGTTIVPASDFAPVEMRGRRITPTDAASRHRGSLTPSPCVGGAPGHSPPTSRRPPLPEHLGVPGTPDNPGASAVPTMRPPPAPTSPPPPLSPATTGSCFDRRHL
jgi:hypothetical protein